MAIPEQEFKIIDTSDSLCEASIKIPYPHHQGHLCGELAGHSGPHSCIGSLHSIKRLGPPDYELGTIHHNYLPCHFQWEEGQTGEDFLTDEDKVAIKELEKWIYKDNEEYLKTGKPPA